MKPLTNNKIIVTGGSTGIGYAVAEELAKEGASTILVARHEEDLKKAVSLLKEKYGGEHAYYVLDVSQGKEVKRMFEKFTDIDGLVNCAGVYGPIGKISEIDLEKFMEAFKINFFGTLYMCAAFIPRFQKSRKGKIVNFAGGGAASPFPNYSAYAVSKVSIVRLTENMALEYKTENLDVNAIAPGFVLTRLHKDTVAAGEMAGKDFLKKTLEEMEKGGADPKQAARLTAFLLSRESDGITGKFISAVWDKWEEKDFQEKLKNDPDFATLRRIDEKTFFKKK